LINEAALAMEYGASCEDLARCRIFLDYLLTVEKVWKKNSKYFYFLKIIYLCLAKVHQYEK